MTESQRGRTATVAWQVLRAPDRLPQILRALLGDAEVSWHPPRPGVCHAIAHADPAALHVSDPAGGTLIVARHQRAFTLREKLAVHLLTGLARRPVLSRTRCRRETLPGGRAVTLRPATLRDLPVVTALHALCAPTPPRALTGFPARDELPHLLHPRVGHSLLAEDADARPVGWGTLAWDGLGSDALLLAADAWKDRGLTTVLLRGLCEAAVEAGCQVLWVYAAHGDTAVHQAVAALWLPHAVDHADADATVYALRLTTSIPPASGPVDAADVGGQTPRPALFGHGSSASDARQPAMPAE